MSARKSELSQLIEKSHQEPENDLLQESVLQQSFQFLTTLPADKHLYCDPEVYAAAVHSLILFSFDETPVLQWLKTKIELWLGSCQKCVAMFHRGRAALREQFIVTRGIPAASVKQFMDLIFVWESQRVIAQLSKSIQEVGQESQLPDQALFMAIIECFYGPEMFRLAPSLKMVFTNVFNTVISTGKFMTPKNSAIFPGLIYLLFEGSDQERKWSLSVLYENTLKQKKTIQAADFDSALVEEFSHHLWKIQDPQFYTSSTCIEFWCNVIPILHACSGECIRSRLLAPLEMEAIGKSVNYQCVPLWKVLSNHIMSFLDHPLPLLLRAFHCLLVKFKSDFWVIASPFIFINYIDPIFQNPHYLKYINVLTSSVATPGIFRDSQPHCNVQDMLRWIEALFESVSGSQQQQAGLKSCVFLLKQEKSPNVRPLFELCFELLDRCMRTPAPLYDSSFGMQLLLRKETRTIFDQNSTLIVAVAAGGHNLSPSRDVVDLSQIDDSLRRKAVLLVASGVDYDVCNFAQVSFLIHAKKNVTSGVSFLPQLWINLAQRLVSNDAAFMAQILSSFQNVCGIVSIREPTSEETVVSKHNENVEKVLAGVVTMLARFGEFQPGVIKSMLRRDDAMRGLWSCVLSFRDQLYQTAVDALYECFDVEGRLEGTRALLELNLKGCLSALNGNLSTLISAKFYEPCPRTVRVLMDVIYSLNDPVEGIFVDFDKYQNAASQLDTFWSRCWAFLDLIYKETLEWATQYPQDELVDFTRDTLDFSHALLDCYRSVNQVVSSQTLFQDVMATFQKMLVWLRLGDTSLLDSCVALIFKTLDLASELGLPFDGEVIMLLAKYGARAKKFNNKLSDQQRSDILDRARAFNDNLVEQVVSAAEEYRVGPKRVEVISLDDDEDETPLRQPHTTKQSQITKFYEKTSSLPLVERKPHRLSSLEKARADLMKNRKSAKAPAPPRPAGFNRSAAAKKDRKKGSGSEESDEDIESLFNGSSRKASPSPRPAPLQPLKKSKRLVDIRKQEEINMRMRLNIDMNPLYRKVLGWSYQRVHKFPEDELNESLYNKITDQFTSPSEYQRTFEPLLLLECWQAIQQQKQVGQEKPFSVVVGSRTSTDSFFDVFASVKKQAVLDCKLGDADLVVLAHNTQPSRSALEKCPVSCLAKVRQIKMMNSEFADVTFRVSTRTPLSSLFTPRTELFAMRIMPMVTIEREYAALRALPYYDLVDDIVKGVPSIPRQSDKREIGRMKELYRVNDSQASAIAGSVSSTGFSLIQGPPGTGKTKTILGMIGYMLSEGGGGGGGGGAGHTVPQVVTSVSGARPGGKKKILLCAPSNAAVDELLMRLRSGIRNASGTEFHPPVVRMGRSDAINPAVKDLTLEEQVDAILSAKMGDSKLSADPAIRQQHTQCLEERNQLRAKLAESLSPEEKKPLEKKLSQCIKRKNDLGKQLDDQRQKISIASRNREIERRNVQSRILSNAQVICATLSGSAHDFLANMAITFDTVVIDEAAQCIELSALIPLKYGCKKCIMVGDPNQLPPTVLSQAAASYKYEQSLFVRMQKTHCESMYLLDVQYRMHPEISRFPSWEFYHSKLIDGPGMKDLNTRPWHSSQWLSPYKFYDIVGRHEQNQRSRSLFNQAEAKVAVELVDMLFQSAPTDNWTGRIGIISPYKEQIRVLRETFLKRHGMPILRVIDFNTVDGFQGQEKEIIIMSCVRSSENEGVGFLGDVRRMNVGLTRARTSLWILGDKESLSRNKVWRALIYDAEKRALVSKAYPGFSKGAPPPVSKSVTPAPPVLANHAARSDASTPKPRKKLATLDNSRRFKSVSEPPEKDGKTNPTKSGKLPLGPKRMGTLPPRPNILKPSEAKRNEASK